MRPSGIEWIGDIPDDWHIGKVKLFYNLQIGFTPDTKNVDYYDNENGYNWVTIKDLNDEYVIISTKSKISELYIRKYNPEMIPKGSLLYSFKLSVGKVAFAGDNLYSNEAIVSFLRDSKSDLRFLYYSSFLIAYNSNENIYGAKLLNQDLIKNAYVVFPPLKTQQKIADYLDEKCGEIDATIAKQKEIIEKLKAYKQSLISETVTKGLDKFAPLKPSGIKWLGEIPQNARIIRLRFLSSIQTGDKDTVNRVENGKYPFYVRSPIVERIDTFSFDGEAILMAGDGVGAGKVFHYVNGKFDYHQRVYNIHNLKGVLGKFLYYYLRENFYKEIEQSNAKSTVDSIRLPMLLDFPIIVYPYDLQKEMVSFLDKKVAEIDAIIIKKQNIIQKLDAYKKSLIFECVTGKQIT